jgi:hypothetical protein
MPDQTVACGFQSHFLAVVDELVGCAEVENTFCGSQYLRFHAILGYGAVEMVLQDNIGFGHLSIALPLVDCRTDETVLAYRFSQTLSKY